MALNLSRIFRGRPEQVAAADVNGDGKADAVHDRYADQEVSYIGETEKNVSHIEPTHVEFPNLVRDSQGINDQTPADWNERTSQQPHAEGPSGLVTEIGMPADDAVGHVPPAAEAALQYNPKEYSIDKVRAPGEAAMLQAQDGSGTDNANRSAQPPGLKFETEVTDAVGRHEPGRPGWYVPDMDSDQSGMADSGGNANHPAGLISSIDFPKDGYTATDDLWQFRDTNQGGAAGGDAARTAGPGNQGFMMQDGELYPRGLRDMEISLGAVGEPQALAGDANGDGVVNSADYTAFRGPAQSGVKWEGPDFDATTSELRASGPQASSYNLGDTATHEVGPHAGFRPNPTGDGTTQHFFKSTSGMDAETERSAHHPGTAHFGDSPGLNGGDMMAKNEVSIESIELVHEGATTEAPDGTPDAAGFHNLPEVDDEVLVSFSALDSDADAPTTLVDLHTPGDVPVEHLQDHSAVLNALHDAHHDIGTHHSGHGHEGIIDHLPDLDL